MRSPIRCTCRGLVLGLVAAALLATGCGQSGGPAAGGAPSSRLVDFAQPPPWINALDIDPASNEFLLTTNRGFFRIDADSDRVKPVSARISVSDKSATLGTFLELAVAGPDRLIGSGHPDQEGMLPPVLGVIDSIDGGRTWRPVSRLGDADLHSFVFKHDRMYAYDNEGKAFIESRDGGKTFTEQYGPFGVAAILDFDVDPANARRLVASSDRDLFRSDDSGLTWRRQDSQSGIRLAWPAPDALYRALKDGAVQRSADRGKTWQARSRVGGEPYKFKAISADELYLALSDGTILHTTNGGKTWEETFRP